VATPIYYLYSDASLRHEAIGYCCVMLQPGRPGFRICGDLTPAGGIIAAEVESLAIGINACPGDAECVIAYSDLDWLPAHMTEGKPVSYIGKISISVAKLREAAGRFPQIEWRHVDRANASYRLCHSVARKEAKNAAKRRGTFNRIPTVKPKKLTRDELFWSRFKA
jgi:hypothetical protein